MNLDGLRELAEEAGLQALLDIVRHRVGARGDDRDVRDSGVLGQYSRCINTADAASLRLRCGGCTVLS